MRIGTGSARLISSGFVGLAALAVLAPPSFAFTARIAVLNAWTRPASASANDAGYLTVTNRGDEPDVLVGATSPDAASVSIHVSRMANTMMTMRTAERIPIPAKSTVEFSPGGLHLMLENLRRPLTIGDSVAITLMFARAGPLRTSFRVASNGP